MNRRIQNCMSVKDGMSAPGFWISQGRKIVESFVFTLFNQHAASLYNSKIACFVKKLALHIYTRIKLVMLQGTLRLHVYVLAEKL